MAKNKELPPLELLRELFEYRDDALRHRIDRKVGRLNVKSGDIVVGNMRPDGYCVVRVNGVKYMLHRLTYQVFRGDLTANLEIDHIDRDRSNNRIDNLRAVTPALNRRNQTRHSQNTTGVNGVAFARIIYTKPEGSSVEYLYYSAQWNDIAGKLNKKNFSIAKYGDSEAFRLACAYREAMIAELNRQGAGYTDHHGLSSCAYKIGD